MAKEDTKLDSIVTNDGETPTYDNGLDYSNLPDAYDEIVYQMVNSRKQTLKKHKTKDFVGVVLDYDEISIEQCRLETHDGFENFLTKNYKSLDEMTGMTLYRIKVYIPELEGYLPNLTLKEVEKYHKIKNDLEGKKRNEDDKEFRHYDFCRKRIHRFKSFYSIQGSQPTQLRGIKVSFTDENFFYGIVS